MSVASKVPLNCLLFSNTCLELNALFELTLVNAYCSSSIYTFCSSAKNFELRVKQDELNNKFRVWTTQAGTFFGVKNISFLRQNSPSLFYDF